MSAKTDKPPLSRPVDEIPLLFHTLRSVSDVASLLEVKTQSLVFWLYRFPRDKAYTKFKVAKRRGGEREIATPISPIKSLQRKLRWVLDIVYKPRPCVHGSTRGRSVVSNAATHEFQQHVLNVDLKDFFPSIHFGRVWGMFKAKPYSIAAEAAAVLAHICCYEKTLPQGAPTSPIVANMVVARLDSELARLARESRCYYSRYVDDLTFSTSRKRLPNGIAFVDEQGRVHLGPRLTKAIADNKFEANSDKVWLRGRNRRQSVTGLTVNVGPNVRRKYANQIRAMLHAWEKFGYDAASAEHRTLHDKKTRFVASPPEFVDVIRGKLEFVRMVRGGNSSVFLRLARHLNKLKPGAIKLPTDEIDQLLERFQRQKGSKDYQRRGYELQDILRDLLQCLGKSVLKSFKRNDGGEQIDGAFEHEGFHYLVECKWRAKLADCRDVDGLSMQVSRSGQRAQGIFMSMSGWSDHVPDLVKQNPVKNTILWDADDLEFVLKKAIGFDQLLRAKMAYLSTKCEPFVGAAEILRRGEFL